jgi:threonyl-tRNA synthetase
MRVIDNENESKPDGAAGAAPEVYDHRDVGRRLDLFHLQEEAKGMVFWHPAGWVLYRQLEEAARRQVAAQGYREVRTPQLIDERVWQLSGHWQHFRGDMFVYEGGGDGDAAALKPVSCPGHIQLVARAAPSYRDLPIRLSEMGLCHRREASGALSGLFRLRQFTQDDGHIFCAEEQVAGEVARFCAGLRGFYPAFGFDEARVHLSTRPASRAGDDAMWDRAEALLAEGARAAGLDCEPSPGGGAFYGPKLEWVLRDRRGRSWQCGTIQVDMVMPERFDLAAGGRGVRPVLLHRALYGSIERFMAVLLEHHGVALPAWLAPEQVRVLPVCGGAGGEGGDGERDRAADAAAEVLAGLGQLGLRASLRDDSATLSRRVRDAHEQGVPYVLVVGAREAARGSVNLRVMRGAGPARSARPAREARELPVAAALAELEEACRPPV